MPELGFAIASASGITIAIESAVKVGAVQALNSNALKCKARSIKSQASRKLETETQMSSFQGQLLAALRECSLTVAPQFG